MCDDAEGGGCGRDGGPQLTPRLPRGSHPAKCMKCKEGSPVLIIRVGDAFCKACFKDYFIHKFRATLGKNRCIYPGEKVLLAFSGGPASSSMVRQVQEGLSQEAAKKLRFKPGIIFIDEGAVCGQSLATREEVRNQVEAILQGTGFPYHLLCLEEVFDLPSSILRSLSCSINDQCHSYKEAVDGFIKQQREKKGDTAGPSLQDQLGELSVQDFSKKDKEAISGTETPLAFHTKELINLFGTVKTLTTKEELLQTLRTHLILHVARTNGYTKVMMGDSCTRVAVKLMTNLCLGRGAFLASDTGFSDNRHGDVLFLRPMREYAAKEIAFYNRFFGVPTVFIPALDTKASERASIHHLIESFLYKLQSEFPSTISTVYRTGEKLSVNPRDGDAKEPSELAHCLLCLCSLDTNVVDGSSLQSTLLSEQLCQKGPSPSSGANSCCGGTGNQTGCCRGFPLPEDASPHTELLPLLCYSCRLTIKDMNCLESLPPYIHSEAERRQCRAAMKQEIQEFLLEEDPEMTPDAPM